MSHSSDGSWGDLLGTLLVAGGLLWWQALQRQREAEEKEQEEILIFLLDTLLNDDEGNVIGDSSLAFRYGDTVDPTPSGEGEMDWPDDL